MNQLWFVLSPKTPTGGERVFVVTSEMIKVQAKDLCKPRCAAYIDLWCRLQPFLYFLANVNSRLRSLYYIAVPSVCLSSVCNVGAPYSAGWNFPQFIFAVWYLGHLLTSTENFTEIVPGEPLRRGVGGLNARVVAKYSDFHLWNAVSAKRCKIKGKLVLTTNRKSYMSFRLVPKSVTLNDPERRNSPYFALFYQIR